MKTLQDEEEDGLQKGSKNWLLNFISLEPNSVQACLFFIIMQYCLNFISLKLNSVQDVLLFLFFITGN